MLIIVLVCVNTIIYNIKSIEILNILQYSKFCEEILLSSLSLSYSRVCGQLRGYQFASTDAFRYYIDNSNININQGYVDGVSITYDTASPKHIWTYAVGYTLALDTSSCPCNTAHVPQRIVLSSPVVV